MDLQLRTRTRRTLGAVLATVCALALGALLFAWSGVYNIAASQGHWAITKWILEFGMRNSVETRARGIAPPPLDNADLYRLGAGHFHSGCAPCHGAPGIPGSPVAQRALPPPPDLAHVPNEWKDRELFWIVKHGVKYTGMPAWVSSDRDDEVWALVAFLKLLPRLDARRYREIAVGRELPPQSGREIALLGSWSEAVGACARCHGADDERPASNLVPMLHGQSAEFLAAALLDYARGMRASGMMQPIATVLSPDAIAKISDYYSRLAAPRAEISVPADAVARGHRLATDGDPAARIPKCATCHGTEALRKYPRLAGQNAAYMANRLRLWKRGVASPTATEAIMAPIARLLNDQQIDDVSAYFSALPPRPADGKQLP